MALSSQDFEFGQVRYDRPQSAELNGIDVGAYEARVIGQNVFDSLLF